MEGDNKEYKSSIIEAINILYESENQIFGAALGVLFTDEWKEIHEAFEVGDKYGFELAQLESSLDYNVKTSVDIIKEIRTAIQTLQNLNGINEDEIN